jgi:DNA-binding beta-propeller fold protein YncE
MNSFLSRHLFALGLAAGASTLAAEPPLLVPGTTIKLAGSTGKFDFLEVDAVNHRLLAGHEKDDTADFFDLKTNTLLARVKVGPAVGVTSDPKTGNYFASVQDDKRVAIIDSGTLKETGSITLPGETDAILFDAKDRRIYVTHDNGKSVWAIDADSRKLIATIAIPGAPECMAHDAASDRIFLNIKDHNEVAVIDTKTNTVVAHWPTAPANGPHGLAFDAVGGRIFSSGENGKLVALDVQTGKVVATVEIVEKVDQIAFDPFSHRVYCAGPGAMSVVQSASGSLTTLGKIATAETAKNVAIDPKTHAVWTTFTDGTDAYAKSWLLP